MKILNLVVPFLLCASLFGAEPANSVASYASPMILSVPTVAQPAPSNLTVRVLAHAYTITGPVALIGLYWKDNSSNEYSFRVESCAGLNCKNFVENAKTAPNVVRYLTYRPYQAQKVYRFRVRANGPHGLSAYSNIVNLALIK